MPNIWIFMPKWIFWIVQQNSKPAKRRQNVLLLSVSHCRVVTIWGQPFKKLPQIHLCTIDCFEALCKTVVTVFFHYCKSCGAGAIEEQRSRRRRSAQLRVWAFAVLPPASRLEGQKQAELLLFLLNPFGRSNLLTHETTKKASRSQDLETAAFSARSIPNQSFLLCCPNLYVQSLLSTVGYLITVHHL